MLPPVPPPVSSRDFDPAALHDQDEEMEEEVEEGSRVELSSVEINILIYLYLLESNLPHTAFTLLSESSLPSTSLFQHFNPSYPTPSSASSSRAKPTSNSSTTNAAGLATPGAAGANGVGANGILGNAAASNASVNGQNAQNGAGGNAAGAPRTGPGSHAFGSAEGRIQRGELIRKLWKGLRWEEVERHVSASGEAYTPQCPNAFHLLIPHSCPAHYPSAINNPAKPLPTGLRVSPPPPESRRPEAFPDPEESVKSGARDDDDKAEAGPSRPRSNVATANSAKRPRTIRASSEDRDEARTPVSRRSASPDLRARREKRDKERTREREREREREGKRPRVSDADTDKERDRDRGRDRDRETVKAKEKDKEGERKALKSGKDKERDRDREKDRDKDKDKDRIRGKDKERERERDKGKSGIPKLTAPAAEAEPASREESPAIKRKRDRGEEGTNSGLAPPRKGVESRSKSPASTTSGSTARQVNGVNATTGTSTPGAPTLDKPTPSRGAGRPPKNASSAESKPTTAKRSRLIDSPPTESANEKESVSAPAKVVRRGKDNPAWIDDDDVAVFVEHKDAVSCLAWNPRNSSVLATGSSDGSARLWEFTDPPGLLTSKIEDADVDMDEPNNTGKTHTPKTLTLSDKILVRHPSIDSTRKTISALAWHPEGSMLATGCLDGVGRLITPDGQIVSVMTYGSGAINGLKFSPDGRWVLTPKSDFSVGLWSVGKGVSEGVKSSYTAHSSDVNDVDWLDDDVFASGANDHRIYVFRTTDKTVRYTFRGHTDDVTRVKWSPSPIPGTDKTSHPNPITPTQAVKANHLLASVSDDGYLMIWRMPSYPLERATKSSSRSVSPVKGGYGISALGDADGERDRGRSRDRDSKEGLLDALHGANGSASAGDAANVPVLSGAGAAGASAAGTATGQNVAHGHGQAGQQQTAGLPDHCIAKIRVSEPDDRRLNVLEWAPTGPEGEMIVAAGAEDSPVKLFNALTSELLHTLPGLNNGVRCLAFSRLLNGRLMLAAAGWYGQLCIYDVRTGEKKGEWAFEEESKGKDPSIRAMAWREDGQYLAICNGNKAVALLYTGGVLSKMSADGPLMQVKQETK